MFLVYKKNKCRTGFSVLPGEQSCDLGHESDLVACGKCVACLSAFTTLHMDTLQSYNHKHLMSVGGLLLFLENEQYSLLTSQDTFLTKLKEECCTLAKKLEQVSQKSR